MGENHRSTEPLINMGPCKFSLVWLLQQSLSILLHITVHSMKTIRISCAIMHIEIAQSYWLNIEILGQKNANNVFSQKFLVNPRIVPASNSNVSSRNEIKVVATWSECLHSMFNLTKDAKWREDPLIRPRNNDAPSLAHSSTFQKQTLICHMSGYFLSIHINLIQILNQAAVPCSCNHWRHAAMNSISLPYLLYAWIQTLQCTKTPHKCLRIVKQV